MTISDDTPIGSLKGPRNTGTRAKHALINAGLETVGDIRKLSKHELRRIPGMGEGAIGAIQAMCGGPSFLSPSAKTRLSELAWVKALLESQLVAVDYPDVIPRIKARMKAIEQGKE